MLKSTAASMHVSWCLAVSIGFACSNCLHYPHPMSMASQLACIAWPLVATSGDQGHNAGHAVLHAQLLVTLSSAGVLLRQQVAVLIV